MANMTIGEVAERAGLQPSALRYYESAGLLPRPERVNGRRRYDPEIIYLLRAIGIAKQAGFTIEEMRQLFREREASEPFSEVWDRFARQKLAEVEALIERAHQMKALLETGLECGCLGMQECAVFGRAFDEDPTAARA